MPRRIIPQINSVKTAVLEEYQNRELTSAEIAKKHGISSATVSSWAKKAGLPLRNPGRKLQKEPSPRQLAIIELSNNHTYEQVGVRFGLHKQSVHRTVKRWRGWCQANVPSPQDYCNSGGDESLSGGGGQTKAPRVSPTINTAAI